MKQFKEFLSILFATWIIFTGAFYIINETIYIISVDFLQWMIASFGMVVFFVVPGILIFLKKVNIIQTPFIPSSIILGAVIIVIAHSLASISLSFIASGMDGIILWMDHSIVWWKDRILFKFLVFIMTFVSYGIIYIVYTKFKNNNTLSSENK